MVFSPDLTYFAASVEISVSSASKILHFGLVFLVRASPILGIQAGSVAESLRLVVGSTGSVFSGLPGLSLSTSLYDHFVCSVLHSIEVYFFAVD